MFEKVSPQHPDKQADRIAGAMVDLAYRQNDNPHIAVEVLLGHGKCHIIMETDTFIEPYDMNEAVRRIAGNDIHVDCVQVRQDTHLADNQKNGVRCGDNGIFRGEPVTEEQKCLTQFAHRMYDRFKSDGKYVLDFDSGRFIVCQSNADGEAIREEYGCTDVNPLGDWTGGTDVDTGATNRKLGSDMGDSVTGAGLFGKDLSKADVSVNIYAWLKAQETGESVKLCCAIGDETVDGKPYTEIVDIARKYIASLGGFEKFAEWGLIR